MPRTSRKIIQSLTWWYQHFLPAEFNFLFYLHQCWPTYDSFRDTNVANAFRDQFGTTHSNGIIQSVLSYFRSNPDVQLIPGAINVDNASFNISSDIIHLIPFTDACTLCEKKLTVDNSRSRQIRVVCERGKILIGNK